MLDRKSLFDRARADLFGGFLSGSQVQGLSNILDEAERRVIGDPRLLAYRLATTFHETARAMVPVREEGGEAYLETKPYYPWVGEGLVQVTWEANAKKFGATKPGDCMSWPVALKALFDGMDEGTFTGRKLGAYFTDEVDDPVGARHVINGTDKAETVAGYHRAFLVAIKTATPAPTAANSNAGIKVDTGKPVLAEIETAIDKAAVASAKVAIPPAVAGPHLLPKPAPRTGLAGLWDRITGKA